MSANTTTLKLTVAANDNGTHPIKIEAKDCIFLEAVSRAWGTLVSAQKLERPLSLQVVSEKKPLKLLITPPKDRLKEDPSRQNYFNTALTISGYEMRPPDAEQLEVHSGDCCYHEIVGCAHKLCGHIQCLYSGIFHHGFNLRFCSKDGQVPQPCDTDTKSRTSEE